MKHKESILWHLRQSPITPYTALHLYGCLRLAARIKDLRDEGYDIRTDIIKKGDTRYAQYTLEPKQVSLPVEGW